jgi:hypothetical protein
MSIQAPPNLTPEAPATGAGGRAEAGGAGLEAGWRALIDAGINDWGAPPQGPGVKGGGRGAAPPVGA